MMKYMRRHNNQKLCFFVINKFYINIKKDNKE